MMIQIHKVFFYYLQLFMVCSVNWSNFITEICAIKYECSLTTSNLYSKKNVITNVFNDM